jgi:hypothetical protein
VRGLNPRKNKGFVLQPGNAVPVTLSEHVKAGKSKFRNPVHGLIKLWMHFVFKLKSEGCKFRERRDLHGKSIADYKKKSFCIPIKKSFDFFPFFKAF